MRLLALAAWPFWYDVEAGNILVFVVWAAAWALRGNRFAGIAFLVVVLLVPRPLMVPAAVWLLWTRPELRTPVAVVAVLVAAATLATGWMDEWVVAMLAASGDVANPSNIGPSRFIGTLPWLAIGIPMAAWLTWKGRVGYASLAASPYWLPYYLLVLVLELPGRWARRVPTSSAPGASP
jgi:hypothetical protein